VCRPRAVIDDDATVGDALRGWPRHAKQLELLQAQQQAAGNDNDRDDKQKQRAKKKTSSQAAAKGGAKSKSKSNVTKEKDDEDIHVADLISQRFLHEYMEQREAEMERERKKKEAREIAAREGRRAAKDRTDIKANKAAQLRAIALADRVEATPFDLWKMDKFTHSARPHVSTFRNGQGPGGASGASPASGGFGGASDHQSRGRHGGGRGGNRNAGRYGNRGGGGSGRFSGRNVSMLPHCLRWYKLVPRTRLPTSAVRYLVLTDSVDAAAVAWTTRKTTWPNSWSAPARAQTNCRTTTATLTSTRPTTTARMAA